MFEVVAFISNWAGVLAFVLTAVNIVSNWISGPGKKLDAKIDRVEDEITCEVDKLRITIGEEAEKSLQSLKEHDRRIQKLEDSLPHLPTKEDLHTLALSIERLSTKLGGVQHSVDRMDRHLLEGGK